MELRFFEVSVILRARTWNVCVLTARDRCDHRHWCKLNGRRRDAKLVLSVQHCMSTVCESGCSCWAWICLELSSCNAWNQTELKTWWFWFREVQARPWSSARNETPSFVRSKTVFVFSPLAFRFGGNDSVGPFTTLDLFAYRIVFFCCVVKAISKVFGCCQHDLIGSKPAEGVVKTIPKMTPQNGRGCRA